MVETDVAGYLHIDYACSLREFGNPAQLPNCGGWILERRIPGTEHKDGMGTYPLFCCTNWDSVALETDLDSLKHLVSLAVVIDPVFRITLDKLQCVFDWITPYKTHYIIETKSARPSKHHRYYARKAISDGVQVEVHTDGAGLLDEWVALYDILIERHNVQGIRQFSRAAFEEQLCVPGIIVTSAKLAGETISMHLWYQQGDVAYSHLAASNEKGYELSAPYALHAKALEYFTGRVEYVHLGAGVKDNDGLDWFKQGWANEFVLAYLCGAILQPKVYKELSGERETGYFPAYRGNS